MTLMDFNTLYLNGADFYLKNSSDPVNVSWIQKYFLKGNGQYIRKSIIHLHQPLSVMHHTTATAYACSSNEGEHRQD
jgi:hypothetical protein